MTIDQIWDAIKQEKQVNWHNGIYEVYSVPVEKKTLITRYHSETGKL